MAVPKKRTGASAQGHRRSNWKATKPATTTCPNCGAIALAHTVCAECGYYKGKPASIKHEDYKTEAVEAKSAKKTAKKETKKQAVAEEKIEEKQEEVKVEAQEAQAVTDAEVKDAE